MFKRPTFFSLTAMATALIGLFPMTAMAQDAPGVSIELSGTEDVGTACRMSFLITNGHAQDIEKAVYELVLFGASGGVAQMTLLDFRDLPSGRPRVRQFQFEGLACKDIPRVLINGAETCVGAPEGGCIDNLNLTTRTGTEVIG